MLGPGVDWHWRQLAAIAALLQHMVWGVEICFGACTAAGAPESPSDTAPTCAGHTLARGALQSCCRPGLTGSLPCGCSSAHSLRSHNSRKGQQCRLTGLATLNKHALAVGGRPVSISVGLMVRNQWHSLLYRASAGPAPTRQVVWLPCEQLQPKLSLSVATRGALLTLLTAHHKLGWSSSWVVLQRHTTQQLVTALLPAHITHNTPASYVVPLRPGLLTALLLLC